MTKKVRCDTCGRFINPGQRVYSVVVYRLEKDGARTHLWDWDTLCGECLPPVKEPSEKKS
jgi:hypothetical protein